jgi:RNA polymerase sigma-70 factor (ECF subfamily)
MSGPAPSDAALVAAAKAKEPWAQEALFRRHAKMVNGLAYRLMGRDDEVDDLVQDVFLAAFSQLDRLKSPEALASWLGGITVRTAHKKLRRRRLMRRLGFFDAPPDVEALIAPGLAPDQVAEVRRLYGVLERLSPEARIALVLKRVEGLSVTEISAQMDLSPATVKRRIEQAERELDRELVERRARVPG